MSQTWEIVYPNEREADLLAFTHRKYGRIADGHVRVRRLGLALVVTRAERDEVITALGQPLQEGPDTRRSEGAETVNATLLKRGDALLQSGIREKIAAGWTLLQIAQYYNIFYNQSSDNWGDPALALIRGVAA